MSSAPVARHTDKCLNLEPQLSRSSISSPSCGMVVSQSLKSLCGLCICSRIFSKVPVVTSYVATYVDKNNSSASQPVTEPGCQQMAILQHDLSSGAALLQWIFMVGICWYTPGESSVISRVHFERHLRHLLRNCWASHPMTALVASLNGFLRNASHALSKGHEPEPFRSDLGLVQFRAFYNWKL